MIRDPQFDGRWQETNTRYRKICAQSFDGRINGLDRPFAYHTPAFSLTAFVDLQAPSRPHALRIQLNRLVDQILREYTQLTRETHAEWDIREQDRYLEYRDE